MLWTCTSLKFKVPGCYSDHKYLLPDTLVNFNGPEKPPEKPVEHAKVILDYPAEQPEELSIKIGDIVEILGKDMKQDGWWEVRGGVNEMLRCNGIITYYSQVCVNLGGDL